MGDLLKNVIVTGATGFIGRALVQKLRSELGNDGRVLGLGTSIVDLTDRNNTFEYFENIKQETTVDHIIHLAALYKAGGWPVEHPATQFYVNMSINVNVLEAWARFFPKAKLTSVLSYCMYPPHDNPHPESELWGTEPEEYLFSYALTKKAQLVGQRAYKREYGLESTSVVLPTIYGPGDSFAENSHVMGALVGKFVRAVQEGKKVVEVWGDGTQEREFLYLEDALEGIVQAALKSKCEVLNIGPGKAHTIKYIAETIKSFSGFRGETKYDTSKFVGVKKRLLDVGLASQEIGWTASTTINKGIEKTVKWCISQ